MFTLTKMSGKGKRKLREVGSSSDPRKEKLNNIKDYISQNGGKVLHKWVSKIESHPPNTQEMMEFLLDVMESPGVEVAKLYSIVLRKIDYIPISRFMKDFAAVAERVKNELNGKKFFLVVECLSWAVHPLYDKSNYFMSILFLCMHKELMDNFIDFACIDRQVIPVHGDLGSDTNSCVVYIDDVSFTGTQAEKNLYIPPYTIGDRSVIFAPVYASAMAIDRVNHEISNIIIITSDHEMKSFRATDIVEEYQERSGRISENKVRQLLEKKLDIKEEHQFLLYTDIKVPDSLSIFPKALFCLKTKGLTYSVVTGKHPTAEECKDETSIVHDGKVLDTVYKQDEWRHFAEDMANNSL